MFAVADLWLAQRLGDDALTEGHTQQMQLTRLWTASTIASAESNSHACGELSSLPKCLRCRQNALAWDSQCSGNEWQTHVDMILECYHAVECLACFSMMCKRRFFHNLKSPWRNFCNVEQGLTTLHHRP